ncbi:hypothetical protein SAMN03159448_03034 [Sinorhizobium sp. NFACC03]|nr:hypothetical protein SAMN03159448_03034 [Sinorhizobium sp. NFACC03]
MRQEPPGNSTVIPTGECLKIAGSPGYCDIYAGLFGKEAAVTIEAVDVDDGGDDAPEAIAAAAGVDHYREAADQPTSALDEIHRAGKHHLPGVLDTHDGSALQLVLAVIEPQRLLISFERVDERDDEVRRGSDAAQLRAFGKDAARKGGEALLIHARLGDERADQAAHELDIAVDVGFELGADGIELFGYPCAQPRLGYHLVLIVRQDAGHQDHESRDDRRKVAWR